jgi:hypothetical protein
MQPLQGYMARNWVMISASGTGGCSHRAKERLS